MKILLAGSTGYVGGIVKKHLEQNHDLIGTSLNGPANEQQHPCDLSNRDAVFRLADFSQPDVVIHAAGNKNIAYCERNREQAFASNCDSVKNIADAFGNARIIYISSDYVFDGQRGRYQEDDRPNPATVYGQSKYCGEKEGTQAARDNFVILRASALYDEHATFTTFLRERLERNEPVECYTDAIYSPTYYRDFLDILVKLLSGPLQRRTYHSCGESTTRYEFALSYAKTHDYDETLVRKSSIANQETFLFPNLSLINSTTRRELNVRITSILDALLSMKRGA